MMNYKKQQLGPYTDLYRLEGEGELKQRYIAYNNILFENINVLADNEKQIIVINENNNGGVIYGSSKYANLALKKLREAIADKRIKVVNSIENNGNKKISFSIEDKWKINL